MKKIITLLTIFAICLSGFAADRKIAVQTYTFRGTNFEDTLKQLNSIGVKYIQAYPGQKLTADKNSGKTNLKMSDADKKIFRDLLNKYDIKVIDFGVYSPKDDAAIKEYFDFAKEMGIPSITTETLPSALPIYEKYAKEYGIKVNVHNHHWVNGGKPYPNPKKCAEALKNYKYIFAEPDNGHWVRSGYDSVEGFKALKGKIGNVHLKNQKGKGTEAKAEKSVSVPFDATDGDVDIKAVLKELDSQGFNGFLIIEYESEKENPLPSVTRCVEFLRKN